MNEQIAKPDITDHRVHSLTIPQAADIFGCSRTNAYARVRAGDWPTVSVGRRKFVPASFVRRQLGIELRA